MPAPRRHGRPECALAFGERVKRRRIELRLSQMRLAEVAGVSHNHVGAIERGEKDAGLTIIVKLAAGLCVDPCQLMSGLMPDDASGTPADTHRL